MSSKSSDLIATCSLARRRGWSSAGKVATKGTTRKTFRESELTAAQASLIELVRALARKAAREDDAGSTERVPKPSRARKRILKPNNLI